MKNNKGRTFAKKFLAGALTVMTVAAGSALPAFAADSTSMTFSKKYTANYPTGGETADYQSPAETFAFASGEVGTTETDESKNKASLAAISQTSWNTDSTATQELSALGDTVKKAVEAVTPTTLNLSTAVFSAGDATTGTTKDVTVTVPTDSSFTKPGVYYYDFHEFVGTTAGVVYDKNNYRIGVKVESKNGNLTVTGIRAVTNKSNGDKVDGAENSYEAGKLTFTKAVSGNLGDTNKEFTVTVKLTAPSGRTVQSDINIYKDTTSTVVGTIKSTDWMDGVVTKTFTDVKDKTSYTLTNIPAGVTCLVTEADYTSDGYKTTYTLNGATSPLADDNLSQNMIGGEDMKLTITNTRDTTIDTGVITNNLPYILILLVAAAGAVAFVVVSRKHRA